MRLLTVLSLILVVSFGTISLVEAAEQKVNDFTLNDLSGKPVTLSKLEGLVILDFWATWCPPCKVEIPYLQKFYDEYKDKGLTIVGVSTESKAVQEKFLSTMRKQGIKMDYILLTDPDGKVTQKYGVQSIPTTIFTKGNLVLIERESGFAPEYEKKFRTIIEKNLPKKK
jgi:peroxiredoxin